MAGVYLSVLATNLLDHMPYSSSTPAKARLRRRKKKRFRESCCERMFLDTREVRGGWGIQ